MLYITYSEFVSTLAIRKLCNCSIKRIYLNHFKIPKKKKAHLTVCFRVHKFGFKKCSWSDNA